MIGQKFAKKFRNQALKIFCLLMISVVFVEIHASDNINQKMLSPSEPWVAGPSGILMPAASSCSQILANIGILNSPVPVYSADEVAERLEAERAMGNDANPALVKFYEKMLAKGGNRYVISPPSMEVFDNLIAEAPNHREVAMDIRRAANVARTSGEPMHFDPILLLGEPGVGKTHFAKTMAQILGTDFQLLPMGSLTAGWLLSGSASQWKGAKPGKVLSGLVDGQKANQIYVVDEIDKVGKDQQYDPLGALYNLLESETAERFVDEFAEVRIDASRILWIVTANDEDRIPAPILNRMNVYLIEKPTLEENLSIVQGVYKKVLVEHPKWGMEPVLREDVLAALGEVPPRDVSRILKKGVGFAFEKGRRHLIPEDLDLSKVSIRKQKMGF